MLAASALSVRFQDDIPHPKLVQSFIQVLLAGYFFWMLVVWQEMQKEAAEES